MDAGMYERALKRTGEVVANTTPGQLGDSTPCGDWDVRTLLNHIVAGCVTFAAGGSGEKVSMSDGTDHLGDDHVAAYEKASADAAAAFNAPGAIDKNFTLPWGDTPGQMALGLAVADAAVHGWDLAKATGQPADIDDDIAEAVYGMTSSMMKPLGDYPRGESFGEPVDVPDDAPIADKALAYLGRQP